MGKIERLRRLGDSIVEITGEELGFGWWLRLSWQAWKNRGLLSDYLDGLEIDQKWKEELERRIPLKPTFFSTAMRLLFENMSVREAFESEAMAFVAYTFDEHIDRGFDQGGRVSEEINRAREVFERGEWNYFYERMDEVLEGKEVSSAYKLLGDYVKFLKKKGVGDEMIKKLLATLGDVLTGEVLINMETSFRPKRLGSFWDQIPEGGSLQAYLSVINPGVVMVGWQHAVEKNPSLEVEIDGEKLKLAKVASFLVRMSDDWGDREEDRDNGSFNLLEEDLEKEFWGWLGEDFGELMEEIKTERRGEEVRNELLEKLRNIGKDFNDEWSEAIIKIAYVAIGVGTEVNDRQFANQK